MGKLLLKRFALIASVLLSWTWAIVTFVLDWIGRSTFADDYALTMTRLPAVLKWITSIPWYVPALLAGASIIALIWSTAKQTLTVMGPLEREMHQEFERQEKRRAELVSEPHTVETLKRRKSELLAALHDDQANLDALTTQWTAGSIDADAMHTKLGELIDQRKARGKLFEDAALSDAALFLENGVQDLAAHANSQSVSDKLPNFASMRHAVVFGTIERDIEQVAKFIDAAVNSIENERAELIAELYRKKRRKLTPSLLSGR